MIWNVRAETEDIIRPQKEADCSLTCMKANGENILQRLTVYLREEWKNEQMEIHETIGRTALRYLTK